MTDSAAVMVALVCAWFPGVLHSLTYNEVLKLICGKKR